MSHSSMVGVRAPRGNEAETTVRDPEHVGTLLDALEDVDCRSILEATSDEPLSASELSDTCDLPLSTTYRKLDKLTEAGLLSEEVRLSHTGKHTSEYVLSVSDVQLTVDGKEGIELRVSHRAETDTAPSLVAGAD